MQNRKEPFLNRVILKKYTELWHFTPEERPKNGKLLNLLRVFVLSVRQFQENRCMNVAASLTFFTIMSLVPISAVGFAIAKGFNLEQHLNNALQTHFGGQKEVLDFLTNAAQSMLEKTNGAGIAAIIGAGVLLWSVIKLFSNIERSFNEVWGVHTGRNFIRKCTDYMAMLLALLLMLALTTTVTAYVHASLPALLDTLLLGPLSEWIMKCVGFLTPFIFSGLFFSFFYIFVPTAPVKLRYALIAGFTTGILYQGLQMGLIAMQVSFLKANPVYGALAALPVFLLWLQLSWIFLLYGAELTYACQNLGLYAYESDCRKLSRRFKVWAMMLIMRAIAVPFRDAQPPVTVSDLGHELGFPPRLINELLNELEAAKLVVRVASDDAQELAYHPTTDVDKITPGYVMQALDSAGDDSLPHISPELLDVVRSRMDKMYETFPAQLSKQALVDIHKQPSTKEEK